MVKKERQKDPKFNHKKFLVDQLESLVYNEIGKLNELRRVKLMSEWDLSMFADFTGRLSNF